MPRRSVTVEGEHLERLDPADPDERGLLIKGEHPELDETLDYDGFNPRMHLTMHEVIANQLWADDPPEAWQAAQRLRDQGMERHAILHELLAVMTEHMYPVLAERREFDTAAYRRALDGLG